MVLNFIFNERMNESLLSLKRYFEYLFNFTMTITPIIGYFQPLIHMIRTKTNYIYPKATVLIVLTFTTMKLILWFFEPYDMTIFFQTVNLIVMMHLLTFFYYYYFKSSNNDIPLNEDRNQIQNNENEQIFESLKVKSISSGEDIPLLSDNHGEHSITTYLLSFLPTSYRYLDFLIYYFFLIFLLVLVEIFLSMHISHVFATNFISYIASFLETSTPFPFFKKIVIKHNIDNIPFALLCQFIFGDLFKVGILFMKKAPYPFKLGSLVQLSMDICNFPVYLIWKYKKKQTIN